MKKIPFLILSMLTLPVHAQSVLSSLNQHQNSLQKPQSQNSGAPSKPTSGTSTPEVRTDNNQTPSNTVKCESQDQTSLPLAYVTSLIQEKDGQLEYTHDRSLGKLSISSPDMIGNCSSMLEWTLKRPEIMGKKGYAVEVKIKQGDNCTAAGCSYKVAKVEKGEFQKFEEMNFKPTLKGFDECLKKSGVIVGGKVVPGAIYNSPVSEKFDMLRESGKLYFLSNGPDSKQIKAKYGSYEHINGCDHYEKAHPTLRGFMTAEDAEKERLDAEARKLKECKVDEYGKLSDFIEKYEGYQSELGEVRDRLILEAAKKSAAAIEAGKQTEDDLKVIGDFDRYVVQPKIEKARALYEELLELEGDAKKIKQEELVKLLADISALGKKPYFLSSHTVKLIGAGKFDDAEKLNNLKLSIEHHQRLGAKQDNVLITPGVASQRINAGKAAFTQSLAAEKERYEYRTGQTSGKSQEYANEAKLHRGYIQTRSQNYMNEIQLEYARIQQGGYCYKYWRNTQKCIQESIERITELQNTMNHYNKIDEELAVAAEAKAKDYGALEAQGRRHIAVQNGEEVPAETKPGSAPQDTTQPTPRREEQPQGNGAYTFQWNGQQQGQPQVPPQQYYQQQAQMMPQGYQQPINPYQNNNMFMQPQNPYMNQNPYMGQQAYQQPSPYGYNAQGGAYNFSWAGGGVPQQPQYMPQQQMPYYNQPYQAYNQYSLYNRRW